MEVRKKAAIPVLALLVGLVATGLSFLAYAKRIKIEDVRIDKQGLCTYPSSAGFAVGILAALFILIHQILITVGTSCFCCRTKFPCNFCGIISFILFILSWASFVITFVSLVLTAVANDRSYLIRNGYNTSKSGKKEECLLASQTLFFGAAFWCIITMVFTLSCYATLMCARRKERDLPRPNLGA